jgi:hypothetical protein
VFSGPSENGFIRIHLLQHRYRGDLTMLKIRNSFVRRKVVAGLVDEEAVQQVEATLNQSPRKYVWKRSCELQMPRTTLLQVLHGRAHKKPYKFTILRIQIM